MPVIGDMSTIAIDGDQYNIKDKTARTQIQTLEASVDDIDQYTFNYEQSTETLKITAGKVGA